MRNIMNSKEKISKQPVNILDDLFFIYGLLVYNHSQCITIMASF